MVIGALNQHIRYDKFLLFVLLSSCQAVKPQTALPTVEKQSILPMASRSTAPTPSPVRMSVEQPVNPMSSSPPVPTAHPPPKPLPFASVMPSSKQTTVPEQIPRGSGEGSGGATPILSAPEPSVKTLGIQNVLIDGQSIFGNNAPSALRGNYQGKRIRLTVQGYFGDAELADIAAVLNNGLSLQVLSVTSEQMVLELNTAFIPDLYLSGPHHLRVLVHASEIRANIRLGEPDDAQILFPQLEEITPELDSQQLLTGFRVKGQYFMRNPFFAQAKIDGQAVMIQPATRAGNADEMLILLPTPFDATPHRHHTLAYATPFGSLAFTSTFGL